MLILLVISIAVSITTVGLAFLLSQIAYAEDVTFIVPGSKNPESDQFFDPSMQIIDKDQPIVFVNPDSDRHRLVVKSADGKQIFDTGELQQNQFNSHLFTEYGKYKVECTIYPHMKAEIIVTDDIATFSKVLPEHRLEIQLSRSPAYPKVGEETFFKLIFLQQNSTKNHPHIDYAMGFDDPGGKYVHLMNGHTVDGAEYGSFTFTQEGSFTPRVQVSGISFIPIHPVTVEFDTITTPEFQFSIFGVVAVVIGATILLGRVAAFKIWDFKHRI